MAQLCSSSAPPWYHTPEANGYKTSCRRLDVSSSLASARVFSMSSKLLPYIADII